MIIREHLSYLEKFKCKKKSLTNHLNQESSFCWRRGRGGGFAIKTKVKFKPNLCTYLLLITFHIILY